MAMSAPKPHVPTLVVVLVLVVVLLGLYHIVGRRKK